MSMRNLRRGQVWLRFKQLFASGSNSTPSAKLKKFDRLRPRHEELQMVESLETRATPSVAFDPTTGALSISADEVVLKNGHVKGAHVVVNENSSGFVKIVLNGKVHTSDPNSAKFDVALAGATDTSVTSIAILGTAAKDKIIVNGTFAAASGQITVDGGAGNDLINVKPAGALLIGGDGDDKIISHSGLNTLLGGLGNDKLLGGDGNDSLEGDDGDDTLIGGAGDDSLQGDEGNDLLNDGKGSNSANGGAGEDSVKGADSDDTQTEVEHNL